MNGARTLRWGALAALAVVLVSVGMSWGCAIAAPGARVATTAIVLPFVIGIVMLRRRGDRPVLLSVPAAILGAFAIWPVLAPPGARLYNGLISGITGGWDSILSANVPVPAQPDAAALAYVLMVLATVVGVEVTLRTRARIWPLVPALAVVVTTYLLGRGGPGAVPLGTTLLMVGCVAFALLRSRAAAVATDAPVRDDGDAPARDAAFTWTRREILTAIGTVLVLGAVMVAVVRLLPGVGDRSPRELHDGYVPQQQIDGALNPLAEVAKNETASKDAKTRLFSVALDRPFSACAKDQIQACPSFPIAYLDAVDAAGEWYSSADLRPSSGSVSTPRADEGPSRTVEQTITIDASYDHNVLPALARVQSVSGDAAELSTVAEIATGLRSFEGAGSQFTYKARSAVPDLDPKRVARASGDRSLTTGGTAIDLADFKNLSAFDRAKLCGRPGDRSADVERLCALEAQFTDSTSLKEGENDKGSTLRALERLLADGGAATSEQFAVAFADLASRAVPTRIVVGYRPVESGQQFDVRTTDLRAWPEVALDGLGWVAFSPFPGQAGTLASTTTTTSTTTPTGSTVPPPTTVPKPNTSGATGIQECTAGADCGLVKAGARPSKPPVALLLSLGALVLVVAALVTTPILRARRRKRARTTGDPATRVAAAWHDAMEALREDGVRGTSCLTRVRAASTVGAAYGDDAAQDAAALGVLNDRALHAPGGPTDAEAETAWTHADRIRAKVDSTRPPVKRVVRRTLPSRTSRL